MNTHDDILYRNMFNSLLEINKSRVRYLRCLRKALLEEDIDKVKKYAKLLTGLSEEIEHEHLN
jgi:hypothetical protein